MSELANNPTNQIPEHIPGQEQLFEGQAYDEQAIAERQAQAEAVLGAVDVAEAENKVRLTKPLSAEDEQATRDALSLIQAPDEELPDSVKEVRDYADNAVEHKEKQDARTAAVAKVLEARLAAHEKVVASKERSAAKRQQAAEQKAAQEARLAKTAAAKETMLSDNAKRQELREAYIAKERLIRGEGNAKLFADEISIAADKHVKSVMHPETEPRTGNAVDLRQLKDEKYGQAPAHQIKNKETSEAVKNFHRAFAEVTPKSKVATEHSSAPENSQATQASKEQKQLNPADPNYDYDKGAPKTPEAKESQPDMQVVTYKPDAEGMTDTAVEFTTKDLKFNLADLPDDTLLITTEETDVFTANTFYANNGEVYNLTHMEFYKNDKGGWSVSEMGDQATFSIGGHLMVNGEIASGPVSKVAVEMDSVHTDDHEESWVARDEESPFKLAEDLIDSVEEAAENDAPPVEEAGTVLIQERPKQVMGWAAKQLKRLRNAPLAVAVRAKNGMHAAKEYFTDAEKGKRRTIVGAAAGALVLAGIAYLELKGSGASQHVADRSRGGSVVPPVVGGHPGLANHAHQAATHGGDFGHRADPLNTVTVHGNSGDTLWEEGTKKLRREGITDPSLKQRVEVMKYLQHLNHINNVQAHFLASQGDEVIKV